MRKTTCKSGNVPPDAAGAAGNRACWSKAAGQRPHGNSLRSMVMQFGKLSEDEVVALNLPTGIPLVYKFDQNLNVIEKRYIGDPAVIEEKVNEVANQGKAK